MSLAGRAYLAIVIVFGWSVMLLSIGHLYLQPPERIWFALAGLTLVTGSFTVKVPGLLARISVSDAFVFASVLVLGPYPAAVIVGIDSAVATLWMRPENRSLLRSLFNVATAALSISVAGTLFYALANTSPSDPVILSQLAGPLFALALTYFLLNTWLVAVALSLESGTSAAQLWRDNFPWLSLNYFGGVSVAALLVQQTHSLDLTTLGIILPLLVITYFTYRTSLGRVEDAHLHLKQLNDLYMSTIETLAMAVDAKDQITHGHIRRVQVFAVELAKLLGVRNADDLRAIEAAALLHDVGKLAIPEHILNKPGPLTSAEFDKMKRHADIGADLLSAIRFPYPVVPIVRHHHEHWNGTGYPSGIAGSDIPLGARILSVVDCFDALTSDRPYRPRLTTEDAFDILRRRRGIMYDPLVVDTFLEAYQDLAPVAARAGQDSKGALTGALSLHPAASSFALIRDTASESSLLRDCTIVISESPHPAWLDRTAQHLKQLTPAVLYVWFNYDERSDTLICNRVSGDRSGRLLGLEIPLGQRVSGWSAATRQPSINSDASLDLATIVHAWSPRLQCTISLPIVVNGQLRGVLSAYATGDTSFVPSHVYAFERIATAVTSRLGQSTAGVVPFSRSSYSGL